MIKRIRTIKRAFFVVLMFLIYLSFIQIGAILYPMWLLMMWSDKGGQAVMDHLNGVLNIGSFFLNFILNVGGFFMALLTGLIGAIRG